jgi:hypothetical protein
MMSAFLEPLECPITDVASVPRRFGVGVLLILMTAFSVLFAAMRTVGARPEIFILVSGLFLGVTLGQILLFEGKKPREASLWAGGVTFPLEVLALCVCEGSSNFAGKEVAMPLVCCSVVFGAPLGYLAGCLVAGVFLAQESYNRRSRQPLTIALLPFTATDFDTLISWLRHAQLFDLWSHGRFRYPLDHEQLAVHLGLTAAEPPNRLCYKAVCGEMQEMVAYVELANINRKSKRATIELAIVDPVRNDRDHLSDTLVWEIMQHAFHQQGLYMLGVALRRNEVQSAECFGKHGFYDTHLLQEMPGHRPDEYRRMVRSNRY